MSPPAGTGTLAEAVRIMFERHVPELVTVDGPGHRVGVLSLVGAVAFLGEARQ
jgi:hypothetical protein